MSQKFVGFHALDGYSVVNSVDSAIFSVPFLSDVSCVATFTGSPVGSIKLQVSNDPSQPVGGVGQWFFPVGNPAATSHITNWVDVANSSQAVAASGSFAWDYPMCGFAWIQAVYTFSSGTGTLSVNFVAKSRS